MYVVYVGKYVVFVIDVHATSTLKVFDVGQISLLHNTN
jgi:hypothetical protein